MASEQDYDIVITNGICVAATDVAPLDIAIKDEKIFLLAPRGSLCQAKAGRVIDAEGGYVMVRLEVSNMNAGFIPMATKLTSLTARRNRLPRPRGLQGARLACSEKVALSNLVAQTPILTVHISDPGAVLRIREPHTLSQPIYAETCEPRSHPHPGQSIVPDREFWPMRRTPNLALPPSQARSTFFLTRADLDKPGFGGAKCACSSLSAGGLEATRLASVAPAGPRRAGRTGCTSARARWPPGSRGRAHLVVW